MSRPIIPTGIIPTPPAILIPTTDRPTDHWQPLAMLSTGCLPTAPDPYFLTIYPPRVIIIGLTLSSATHHSVRPTLTAASFFKRMAPTRFSPLPLFQMTQT